VKAKPKPVCTLFEREKQKMIIEAKRRKKVPVKVIIESAQHKQLLQKNKTIKSCHVFM